jgi:hypothetical protein|tara:strand:+ start:501 stop:722 length:222 start_codon:yes stop_codon:yes gene_type:complete
MTNKKLYNPEFREKVKRAYYEGKIAYYIAKSKGEAKGVKEFTLHNICEQFNLSYNQVVRLFYSHSTRYPIPDA